MILLAASLDAFLGLLPTAVAGSREEGWFREALLSGVAGLGWDRVDRLSLGLWLREVSLACGLSVLTFLDRRVSRPSGDPSS